MKEAVGMVVGRVNPSDRYKVQLALKFLKTKLAEFRSEERRMNEGSLLYYNYINFPGTGSCTIQESMLLANTTTWCTNHSADASTSRSG